MRHLERAPQLRGFAERVLTHPRSFALNVSNVRGPRHPVHVLGGTGAVAVLTRRDPGASRVTRRGGLAD